MFGGFFKPEERFGIVFLHAEAFGVVAAEIVLGGGMSGFGSEAKPLDGPRIIGG